MKDWKWWPLAISAFAFVALMIFVPPIKPQDQSPNFWLMGFYLIVLGGILFYNRGTVIVNATGRTINFALALVGGIGLAIGAHLLVGWLFGAGYEAIFEVKYIDPVSKKVYTGIPAMFHDASLLKGVVVTEILALVITMGAFYLWITSERKWHRGLVVTTMVLSFLALCYQWFNGYVPTTAQDVARRQKGMTLVRESKSRWFESWFNLLGWITEQSADMRMMVKAGRYPIITINRPNIPLYKVNRLDKEGKVVDFGEPVDAKVGSQWIVHPLVHFTAQNSGMDYIQVVDRLDENVVRYIRQDWLNDILENPTLPLARPTPASVQTASLSPMAAPRQTPAPALASAPAPPFTKSTVDSDTVLANADDWTNSKLIPYPGDVIEFGPFADPDDVDRLLCRQANKPYTDLEPVDMGRDKFVGRVTAYGGQNFSHLPTQVKLNSGPPLRVQIRRVYSN